MEKTSQKPRVVILGAGFGGLTAARAMADTAHVTVVDRHNFQTFLPLLIQFAVRLEKVESSFEWALQYLWIIRTKLLN
jgi:NADH dehydrogenase FAD-containing subunit